MRAKVHRILESLRFIDDLFYSAAQQSHNNGLTHGEVEVRTLVCLEVVILDVHVV